MNAELWVSIVLALISMVSGWGWLTNSRKYRQEVKSLEAENRQKYIDTMSKSEQSDSVAVIVDLIEKNRKQ